MSIGKKMTFWELINSSNIESIEIPQIQRDYVQGRHTPQVKFARERLLAEIKDALENGNSLDLNFVYGKEVNKVFVPIDGQQRLTTLLTLHIYAFAKEDKKQELKVLKHKFTYLTRLSTQRFLEELVDNIAAFFEQKENDLESFIKDAAWYSSEWDKDPSVGSFIVVLNDIDKQFKTLNNLSDKLMDSNCTVSFMALTITDVGLINDLYIKMNSRGKALTEFETFKSEFFDYLDSASIKPDFKEKSDNAWLSMIWNLCKAPEKECDAIYMSFLHRIIMNRLTTGDYKTIAPENWENLNDNNGFYNFADYKPFLFDGKALNDVYYTFELCQQLISEELGNKIYESGKLNYANQVQIVALTKYAVDVPKDQWSVESWKAWNRVITNLINNTEIDKSERFSGAANSIYSMDKSAPADAYTYFAAISESKIDFFSKTQVKEEILKCNLINSDSSWLPILKNAEVNAYFNGEIQFALTLSNINNAVSGLNSKKEQLTFQETWKIINMIFDSTTGTKLCVDDSLFRRALLTYGDYSIWASSTHTLFFEGGKGYFNWRRMLRESLPVFSKLFDDLKAHGVNTSGEIEDFLQDSINKFNDRTDELIYYMVKTPALLNYMREKRFRRSAEDAVNGRNILYSGARLSTDYAEAYSFCAYCKLPGDDNAYHYGRGYLDSATTSAYIERINGNNVHIAYDYSKKCFCGENRNPMLDDNGDVITTVEDLLASLKGH